MSGLDEGCPYVPDTKRGVTPMSGPYVWRTMSTGHLA